MHASRPPTAALRAGELWAVPAARLEALYSKRGPALARLAWGIDDASSDIKPRMLPRQISNGKSFRRAARPVPSAYLLQGLY
jgi:hypothetical protein